MRDDSALILMSYISFAVFKTARDGKIIVKNGRVSAVGITTDCRLDN
jgi:hypothetical protein